MDEGRRSPQYPIESVDNALKLLLLFGERKDVRLTDASRYLGVASSTAHRLLAMLQYRGFVRQNPTSRAYEPGSALSSIASAVMRRVDVRTRAHPFMEQLSASLGETVHLGRLEGTTVHFLDSVESPRAVRVASRLGTSMPAHCTSNGKALLSTLDDDAIRSLYRREKLPGITPKSIHSRKALLRELATVRDRGWATSEEESEDGVASVAVPIGEVAGSRYAMNVSAPVSRMSDETRLEIADALTSAVREIAAAWS